jgi:hypothetical protein
MCPQDLRGLHFAFLCNLNLSAQINSHIVFGAREVIAAAPDPFLVDILKEGKKD